MGIENRGIWRSTIGEGPAFLNHHETKLFPRWSPLSRGRVINDRGPQSKGPPFAVAAITRRLFI